MHNDRRHANELRRGELREFVRALIESVSCVTANALPLDPAAGRQGVYFKNHLRVLYGLPVRFPHSPRLPVRQPLRERVNDDPAIRLDAQVIASERREGFPHRAQFHLVVRTRRRLPARCRLTIGRNPSPTTRSGIAGAGSVRRDDLASHIAKTTSVSFGTQRRHAPIRPSTQARRRKPPPDSPP